MEFFKKTPNIDFMGRRRIWFLISALIVTASLLSVAVRGLNWGVDFTGGTLLEVHYPEAVDLDSVRDALDASGVGGATAQHFGSSRDVMIRLAPEEGATEEQASTKRAQQVLAALQSKTPGAELRPATPLFAQPRGTRTPYGMPYVSPGASTSPSSKERR